MIVSVHSAADLAKVVAERRHELGMSQEDLEHRVGLTHGHVGKIENAGKDWAKKILDPAAPAKFAPDGTMQSHRAMSATVDWVLEALGLELMIVDRETARKLTGPVMQHRERPHTHKATQTPHPLAQRLKLVMTRRPNSEEYCK